MTIFDSIIIDTIFILLPLFAYFLFNAHQKTCGKQTSALLFDIALYTSLYLILRYGIDFIGKGILMITIPLFIAYVKNKPGTGIIMSLFIGSYYYFNLHFHILPIILEFVVYFILYIILNRGKKSKENTIIMFNLFAIIKFIILFMEINNPALYKLGIINLCVACILYYLILILIYYLIEKSEESLNLRLTIKSLEKQKQLRDSLFKITHEIKNPIAVCKGYLDMFDINNKKHVERYVPIIKQEIDRTITLINDFLNLTKLKVELTKLDMSVLLSDTCDSLKLLVRSNNIKFKYEIFDEEVDILGDYDRLKQVFINVIKNAIEAIPKERKGVIKLLATSTKKKVIVTIEDNGIGMDKETINKIGEPFFTTKKGGTGLGVRFSKEIIEAHDGKITYNSEINKGTTVVITLPIIKNP